MEGGRDGWREWRRDEVMEEEREGGTERWREGGRELVCENVCTHKHTYGDYTHTHYMNTDKAGSQYERKILCHVVLHHVVFHRYVIL